MMTRDEFIQEVINLGMKVKIQGKDCAETEGWMANPAFFDEDAWEYIVAEDPEICLNDNNLVIVSEEPDGKKISIMHGVYPTVMKTSCSNETQTIEYTCPKIDGISEAESTQVGKMFKEWLRGLHEEDKMKE